MSKGPSCTHPSLHLTSRPLSRCTHGKQKTAGCQSSFWQAYHELPLLASLPIWILPTYTTPVSMMYAFSPANRKHYSLHRPFYLICLTRRIPQHTIPIFARAYQLPDNEKALAPFMRRWLGVLSKYMDFFYSKCSSFSLTTMLNSSFDNSLYCHSPTKHFCLTFFSYTYLLYPV